MPVASSAGAIANRRSRAARLLAFENKELHEVFDLGHLPRRERLDPRDQLVFGSRYYESPQSAGKREYPATPEDLLQDRRSPALLRHLREIFVDPMTGKAQWGLVRVGERIVGVHSLSERAPIKQDGFDAAELSLTRRARTSELVFAHSPQAPAGARPSPTRGGGARPSGQGHNEAQAMRRVAGMRDGCAAPPAQTDSQVGNTNCRSPGDAAD